MVERPEGWQAPHMFHNLGRQLLWLLPLDYPLGPGAEIQLVFDHNTLLSQHSWNQLDKVACCCWLLLVVVVIAVVVV